MAANETPTDGPTVVILSDSAAATPGPAASRAALPDRIGRYEVEEEIGEGGMGRVLRAHDPALDRDVALKLLRGTIRDPVSRARVIREAQAMAQLSDPHVVPVYDVGTHDGEPYIAMELVHGRTLTRWLREHPNPSAAEILRLFESAARGLAAAHRAGLVHRDFKPSNVLVGDDGRVRVMDFGLARWAEPGSTATDHDAVPATGTSTSSPSTSSPSISGPSASSTELTTTGTVMGTAYYMAPEQHTGGEVDARSDQYAFCVALWEGLFGERPFSGSYQEIFAAKRRAAPILPARRDVPPHVGQALLRGLMRRPSDRFPSMEALLHALSGRTIRWRRGGLVLAGLGTVALALWGGHRYAQAQREADCLAEGQAIEAVWGPERRGEVAAALHASGAANADMILERLTPWLDRWTTAWSEARRDACLATPTTTTTETPTETTEGLDTVECLDERRTELQAFVDTLRIADRRTALEAVTMAASLPPVEPCSDLAWLSRRDPLPSGDARARALALRSELVEAMASHTLSPEQRSERFDALDAAAAELNDAPLRARIMLARAQLASDAGDYQRARELGEAAFERAQSALADEVAARSAEFLTLLVGMRLGDTDAGLRWGKAAQTYLERLGEDDGPLAARHLSDVGSIHTRRGELDQALALHGRALAIAEEKLGADHPDVATSLTGIAAVHHERGEFDAARARLERVLEIKLGAFGELDIGVAQVLSNLSLMDMTAGRYDEAEDSSRRSLAILEQIRGQTHPHVTYPLINLANIASARGDDQGALKYHERVPEILEAALGPDAPDVAKARANLGNAYVAVGRDPEALALFRRSLRDLEAALGPDHSRLSLPLVGIATVQLERGELEAAREHATRGLAVIEHLESDLPTVAQAHFVLARVTYASGGDREEAIALARRASDELVRAGAEETPLRERIEAWIAAPE